MSDSAKCASRAPSDDEAARGRNAGPSAGASGRWMPAWVSDGIDMACMARAALLASGSRSLPRSGSGGPSGAAGGAALAGPGAGAGGMAGGDAWLARSLSRARGSQPVHGEASDGWMRT